MKIKSTPNATAILIPAALAFQANAFANSSGKPTYKTSSPTPAKQPIYLQSAAIDTSAYKGGQPLKPKRITIPVLPIAVRTVHSTMDAENNGHNDVFWFGAIGLHGADFELYRTSPARGEGYSWTTSEDAGAPTHFFTMPSTGFEDQRAYVFYLNGALNSQPHFSSWVKVDGTNPAYPKDHAKMNITWHQPIENIVYSGNQQHKELDATCVYNPKDNGTNYEVSENPFHADIKVGTLVVQYLQALGGSAPEGTLDSPGPAVAACMGVWFTNQDLHDTSITLSRIDLEDNTITAVNQAATGQVALISGNSIISAATFEGLPASQQKSYLDSAKLLNVFVRHLFSIKHFTADMYDIHGFEGRYKGTHRYEDSNPVPIGRYKLQ